jgi:alpha/beta superfamily hydrolase
VRASVDAKPARLVAVAPAVDRLEIGAVTPGCPWLVVLGDADEVVAPQRMLEWARGLRPLPDIQVMAGAGHFFHGLLPQLREAVTDFVNRRPR